MLRERFENLLLATGREGIADLLKFINDSDFYANFYKQDVRNVKNNGVWEQVPVYTINDTLPLGHGEKSVMILQQYIELTTDEIYAIRWHMGGFDDTAKSYAGGLQLSAAFDKCPLLVMLHMADLAAVYLLNKEG